MSHAMQSAGSIYFVTLQGYVIMKRSCILRTHVLGMHTKFQKNTPKNKISVYNAKLQVMQTRRTLMTS